MNWNRKDWIWTLVALACGIAGYTYERSNTEFEREMHVAARSALQQQTDELRTSTINVDLLKGELSQFRGLIDGWNNLTEGQRQFFKQLLLEEKTMPPIAAPQEKSQQ